MMTVANGDEQREKLLSSLFEGYEGPAFGVRLWDGWRWQQSANREAKCTIIVNSASALQSLLLCPSEVTLGEAFLTKDIDVEGDIFSVFDMAEHVFHGAKGRRRRILEAASGLLYGAGVWLTSGGRHSQKRDSKAISYHYDQPVDFYKPWLGNSLVYSCAYFQSARDSLDTAQANKLELICRKLRLEPGQHFLDIGCGWGSLILHAACRYNVDAYGITLSREQQTVASDRIAASRLTQCCHAELLDYRKTLEILPPFDKIASVGMFEHVGFCQLHTWQYEGISSPQGVCESYPKLVYRIAAELQNCANDGASAAVRSLLSTSKTCRVCQTRAEVERRAIEETAAALHSATDANYRAPACCLPHLALLVDFLGPGELSANLIESHAALLERTAEDLQRYALKHDALRRHLTSEEERRASQLALLLLAGHRNVSSPWVIESIL